MTGGSSRERIKRLLVESLNLEGLEPEEIGDDAPLWGDEGLGLDSVDALELMVALEKEFDIRIDSDGADQSAFATVATISDLVDAAAAPSS